MKLGAVQMSYDGLWGRGSKALDYTQKNELYRKISSCTGGGGQLCRKRCYMIIKKPLW